jgi:hypothetical protein
MIRLWSTRHDGAARGAELGVEHGSGNCRLDRGIGGTVLGVLGGAIGTYFGIKNTAGLRERAFMVRTAALLWVAVIAFLVALWLTPQPYQPLLWLSYVLLLCRGIRAINRRQEQIRREEAARA